MSDPESMIDRYGAQLGICHERIAALETKLDLYAEQLLVRDRELSTLREESEQLKKGFNSEGETSQEYCCMKFKSELKAELARLRAENERLQGYEAGNVK